jgi:hypothetical protein
MMKTVTKETMATRFEHISLKNSDKSPVQAKRNGKTQTWKTRPNEFKIPYFYIDQNNCNNWIEV